MGEMIGNIAHQWRQPLTHLSYTVMNIQDAFKHKSLDEVYLDKKVDEANFQIEFMSQTIDDFRDFYALSKSKETFSLVDESKQVLSIMQHSLEEMNIVVELIIVEDLEITNYKNEYKQVLLNLLSNAKDALVDTITMFPKVTIKVNKNKVTVSDNAGGIQEKNIDKIFEPYFSSKENHSGIGLYMSKMIVEKNMGGKLSVRNDANGAIFTIIF
jgi:signal transduction histidine kinase